jgi:uncharacterized membrane protein required for colicin V production
MYIDIFVLIIFHWALFSGWKNGFIKEVFSTLGILTGLIVAGLLYLYCGDILFAVVGSETNMMLSIGAFLLFWIALPLVFGLIANILTSAIKGMQLGIPNSLLGSLFSVAKFTLLVSCAFNMMHKLDILDESKTADSKTFQPALQILPFIEQEAEISRTVKTTIGNLTETDTIWVDMLKKEKEDE